MLIEVYCPVHNEERIIPYFMRHYSQFAHVILLENNSTDRTVDIARAMGATVIENNIPDEYNEDWIITLKNHCWKKSKAEWAMIVDADEFICHPDIKGLLSKTTATLFEPAYFNMFSDTFPSTPGQIYSEVRHGTNGGIWKSKVNVFRPSAIREINYSAGCHSAMPLGIVCYGDDPQLKTLHMKYLGKEYSIQRAKEASARLSRRDREREYCVQFDWSPEKISFFIDNGLLNAKQVI